MGRSTVVCQGKHTALYKKDDMRGKWLWEVPQDKDIITISHGAFSVLNILRWKGRIYMCDIDKGVVESATYLWEDKTFSYLNLYKPLLCDIRRLVVLYAYQNFGTPNLGAVDLDLANLMSGCIPVVVAVIQSLQQHKIHTKVLLTFCNARDADLDSLEERIQALRNALPSGSKIVKHTPYTSMSTQEDASRDKGSSMCLVELST